MRSARLAVALLVVVCCSSSALANRLDGYVYLTPIDSSFSSWGSARFYDDLNRIDYEAALSGTHSVSGPSLFETSVHGYGVYSYEFSGRPSRAGRQRWSMMKIPDDRDTKSRRDAVRRGSAVADVKGKAIDDQAGGTRRRLIAAKAGRSGRRDTARRIEEILRQNAGRLR